MGQAIADLPNSDEKSAEPVGSADDLLSQLAGEEIDRLLAEADAHPSDEPAHPPLDPSIMGPPSTVSPAQGFEEMPAPVTASEIARELADASPQTDTTPFDAQVDELFKELKDLPDEEIAASAPAESPAQRPISEPTALLSDNDQSTTAAERAALQQPAATPVPQVEATVNVRPSVIVRILELINSPVNSLPDSLRDALGKVAILTFMNSVGVLLYLFLFRK